MGPGVAMESRECKGGLHLFSDHFLPEVVDPATGEQLAEGELGELVLTTLTKQAQPVMRYRTGDLTRLLPGDCPCGRTFPRMARLTGRVDDMLVIRGINVFPSEIEAVVLDDQALSGQYAIVVDRRATLPELEVRVELARAGSTSDRALVADRIAEQLLARLRLRVVVEVGPPGSVPRQETGKAKRVFERTDGEAPLV
jgi:phenylacetate-CoA ligase